jgi:hypothetical protein
MNSDPFEPDAEVCVDAIRNLAHAIERALDLGDISGQAIYAKAMLKFVNRIIALSVPYPPAPPNELECMCGYSHCPDCNP